VPVIAAFGGMPISEKVTRRLLVALHRNSWQRDNHIGHRSAKASQS
jgi:hypothetical protein